MSDPVNQRYSGKNDMVPETLFFHSYFSNFFFVIYFTPSCQYLPTPNINISLNSVTEYN